MTAHDTAPLLIELGTEELPPKALDELAAAFANGIVEGLVKRGIAADIANAKTYCSPRRLAVLVPAVGAQQPMQKSEVLGPYLNIGLDANGTPTPALAGFAAKNGLKVDQLERISDAKGERFVARNERPGQPTAALIPEIVADALKSLPIPKPMRWGDHDYAFVRPVHWLVMLHGDKVVDGDILGLKSGRMSRGHRFHHPQPVHVVDADSWLDAMHAAKVIADPVARRERVRAEVARVAPAGTTPRLSDALCDEIANLTEWPVAIACAFDKAFLAVPQEALVMTMETNQKFVPCFDADGKLTEHFIGVANIESKDPAEIRKGYERVIRPRFADAKFFFDEDLKAPLAANMEALKNVTYQQALGSVWDKSVRVAELARVIANRVGVDAGRATRAAALSKCDLLTRMVGEFPELQGVMGRTYATANGEDGEVARALDEFYAPRFAGDAIAQDKVAQVLAVAERLDTLAGIFAVGMKPSGNKDPFALRRAALGLARTLIEGGLELDLPAQIEEALAQLPDSALEAGLPKGKDGKTPALDAGARRATLANELYDFILDRLRGYYADTLVLFAKIRAVEAGPELVGAVEQLHRAKPGTLEEVIAIGDLSRQRDVVCAPEVATAAFEAVRALAPSDLADFDRRLRAVVEFAKLPEASALAAANKRIGNILRQAEGNAARDVDASLLEAGAERELADAVAAARSDAAPLIAQRDYVGLLKRLAALRAPVDRYFDTVMVMADDARVRANRIALLEGLRSLFLRVADISLLPAA